MDRRAYLFHHLTQVRVPDSFALGAKPLILAIAGVRFTLATSSDELRKYWENYFCEYGEAGPAAAEIFVEPLKSTPVADVWHDVDPEFESRGDAVVQRDFAARRFEQADAPLRVVAFVNLDEPGDATHNLLRWVLPDLLLRARCFLMHSASFVHEGDGFLFFGQSGAGKSTTVALVASHLNGATILGDDAGILGLENGEAWLHSAPLGSGYSRLAPPKQKVLLRGIFSLEQADHHAVQPLPAAEAVRSVLASAMTPDFSRLADARFDLAVSLVLTPCGVKKLFFKKDLGFWPLLSATPRVSYNKKLGGEWHVIG